MNTDLLLTEDGEAGLVADGVFSAPVAGIVLDAQTGMMTAELSDLETVHFNIPVEEALLPYLLHSMRVHVGLIEDGSVQDARLLPLLLLNDPYGSKGMQNPARPVRSIPAFENFMKRCVTGQPVHRDNLGDENTIDGVTAGLNRAVLQFAPHLARERALQALPKLGPSGPAAPGMGLGSKGGGGRGHAEPRRPPARYQREDDDGRD